MGKRSAERAGAPRWDGDLMILKINAHDPDVRRRGRILAIILLGITACAIFLSVMNVLRNQPEHHLANAISIALLLGLFVLNRLGYVTTASILTVVLTTLAPVAFFSEEDLARTFIIMCIPVFIASFLIVPWGALVVSTLVISYVIALGQAEKAYLSLFTFASVTIIIYLLSRSLDRAYRENRHRALHDDLTGLPNRALFIDRLRQAIDRSEKDGNLRAVLFMDLDHFKVVNDSLGHEAGDELLVEVARRLPASLRPGDTAARLGGDEFTILLDEIADAGDAVRVSEGISQALKVPIELRGRRIFVSTSVGIALSRDGDGEPSTLLRNADVAMYEAKREGKARCKVFNSGMHAQALERLELENDLRRGIERGELRVHYQPKVTLSTGRITGMEALVRWEHPERGLISPGEFIPLAEEIGLIVPLGRWVLREACRQTREWLDRYPDAPPLATSVNLSVMQFQDSNLIPELEETLRETGLDPSCLQLEITESVVASDVEYAAELLRKLKGLGVQLAIDDFGTGYSSLASLQQFPLDDLKIDRAFIEEIGANGQGEAIAQLVIDLAHAMGMQAIAEGVETAEQLARLRDMGCDQAQGFYFWKPLAAKAAEALLVDSPPRWLLGQYRPAKSPRTSPEMFLGNRRYSDPK